MIAGRGLLRMVPHPPRQVSYHFGMDELSPLFQDIEFRERLRGYDVAEVDAYIERVARAAALVHGRITELQQRADAAEALSLIHI